MMYVALLRGINIGGRNKIDMKTLKKSFETAGMTDVITYINSGNIIFTNKDLNAVELSGMLEAVILENFGLNIKVLLRSIDDIENTIRFLPDSWKNDKDMKSDVIFLWDDIDDESILEDLKIRSGIDNVIYRPGTILWSVDKINASKSGMSRIVGTELYRKMTIRNVNTVRKIHSLMQEAK